MEITISTSIRVWYKKKNNIYTWWALEISKKDFASLWHSSWKSALCIAVRNLCSISPIFAVKFRCKRENEKPWLFRWSKRSLRLDLKVEKHLLILSSKGENSPCWTSAKIGLGNKDEARRRLLADHTCWRKVIFSNKDVLSNVLLMRANKELILV